MTDFLDDNFVGTGSLATHVPDINTWIIPAVDGSMVDGRGTWPQPLNTLVLDGAGAMQVNINSAKDGFILRPATPAGYTDYYVEVEVILPALSSLAHQFAVEIYISGRTVDNGDGSMKYLGSWFSLYDDAPNYNCHSDVIRDYSPGLGSIGTSPGPDYGNFDTDLGPGPTTVTCRAEFAGRKMSLFLNGVAKGWMTWTDPVLDGPGNVNIEGFIYYNSSTGAGYGSGLSPHRFGRIHAGSVTPVTPSAFWQDFDKTVETDAVFLSAEPQTPPYVAPKLEPELAPSINVPVTPRTALLEDDFSGSGDPDPTKWAATPLGGFAWFPMSGFKQAGGLLVNDVVGNGSEMWTLAELPTVTHGVKATITRPSGGIQLQRGEIQLGLSCYDVGGYFAMYYLLLYPGGNGLLDWMLLKATVGGHGYNCILYGDPGTENQPIGATFTVELRRNTRTNFTVLLDDVQVGVFNDPETSESPGAGSGPALPGPGRVYVALENIVNASLGISRIEVQEVTPIGSSSFWQDFVHTVEADT
jgi:hypothetical protein